MIPNWQTRIILFSKFFMDQRSPLMLSKFNKGNSLIWFFGLISKTMKSLPFRDQLFNSFGVTIT